MRRRRWWKWRRRRRENNKNTATNQNASSNETANERLSNSGQPIKTTMTSCLSTFCNTSIGIRLTEKTLKITNYWLSFTIQNVLRICTWGQCFIEVVHNFRSKRFFCNFCVSLFRNWINRTLSYWGGQTGIFFSCTSLIMITPKI